ncbi:hypothetical protein [Bacillus atrophaeus]|uniref:hypothetical protein n=1 Tax=Bacillus atrophaeus TaxID=1452 RepID=UPI002E1E5D05|nr:hypothetical protein [Bacillus atrophaeus]
MAKDNKGRQIVIEENYGLKFKPLLNMIKEKVKFLSRGKEKGIVNKKSGSSVVVRENGNINVVSSANSQYKLSRAGKAVETTHESETITNRKKITADDIVINNHKLNPKLYELSDMKSVYNDSDKVVGNLTMFSTVLVKAWEPTLEKYVLIRRLARVPVFSPELNTPDIHPDLDVDTELKEEFADMVEIEKMSDMLSDFSKQGDDKQ